MARKWRAWFARTTAAKSSTRCKASPPERRRSAMARCRLRNPRDSLRPAPMVDASDEGCASHGSSGIALVHLISSRQTLDFTPLTPGMRIRVSSRKSDSDFKSFATTFST